MKGKLQGFMQNPDEQSNGEQNDTEQAEYQQGHKFITYPGILTDQSPDQISMNGEYEDRIIKAKKYEWINGIYDAPNLQKNVKALDQYYGRQLNIEH